MHKRARGQAAKDDMQAQARQAQASEGAGSKARHAGTSKAGTSERGGRQQRTTCRHKQGMHKRGRGQAAKDDMQAGRRAGGDKGGQASRDGVGQVDSQAVRLGGRPAPSGAEVVDGGRARRVALLAVDAVDADSVVQQLAVQRAGTVLHSMPERRGERVGAGLGWWERREGKVGAGLVGRPRCEARRTFLRSMPEGGGGGAELTRPRRSA
eukprot:350623-Chlamydomonas_euryale.AAC.1